MKVIQQIFSVTLLSACSLMWFGEGGWWWCIAFLRNIAFPQARSFSSKNVENKHLAQDDVWTCPDYSTDRSLYGYDTAPVQTQKNLDKCFTSRPITWMFHVLKKTPWPLLQVLV